MQYIKAPRALAAYLGLLDSRSTFADGSYLLWDRDLMRLAGSGSIEELLPQVGSVILTAPDVRAEQNEECEPHPLPPVTLPVLIEYMQSHGYPLPESDPQEEQPESESGEPDPDTESGDPVPDTESGDPVPDTESGDPVPDTESGDPVPDTESDPEEEQK